MDDFLTITVPGGKSFRRELGTDPVSIGRSSQNDCVLEDPGVSRQHAKISLAPEGYILLDAGGKNGTFLNGARVEGPALLRVGDQIRIGSTTLTFNADAPLPVEFVDTPLPVGSSTTVLQAKDIVSSGGAISVPSLSPTDPRRDSLDSGLSSGSFVGLPALSVIWEADKELLFHHPLAQILERTVDLVGRAVSFDRALLMLLENGRLVPRVVRMLPGEDGQKISVSKTIADRVVQRQESVLTDDAQLDERFKSGQSIVAQNIRSAMCVPLWNNQEVIGLLYIDSRRRAGLFKEDHLRLLTHLANVAAVKIENVRLFEQKLQSERTHQELERAAEIQRLLLPASSPPIPGYEVFGRSEPCRVVGGDLFDYIEMPDGRYGIALGDVAGKGYPAALLMSAFQASMRALCELDMPVDMTIDRLNKLLCRRFPDNRFVTFFYGLLDPADHTLSYVNAGHCPPWIVRTNGTTERLDPTGGPLGLFVKSTYEAKSVTLEPGEFLACYSDGVTEAVDPAGEEFGDERLLGVLKTAGTGSPTAIATMINDAIETHYAGAMHEDDVTIVVIRRN